MEPTPFEIFCGYYLGLDREFRYRFFNLNSLAEYLGVEPSRLVALMHDHHMSPEDTRHVDFNIARAHAGAQEIAGKGLDVESFARKAFSEYMEAVSGYDPSRVFEDVDYDDLFPEKRPDPDGPA